MLAKTKTKIYFSSGNLTSIDVEYEDVYRGEGGRVDCVGLCVSLCVCACVGVGMCLSISECLCAHVHMH